MFVLGGTVGFGQKQLSICTCVRERLGDIDARANASACVYWEVPSCLFFKCSLVARRGTSTWLLNECMHMYVYVRAWLCASNRLFTGILNDCLIA